MYEAVGSYEDMLALIAREEYPSRAGEIPVKSTLARFFIEPVFQVLGILLGVFFRVLPASVSYKLETLLYDSLVGENPVYPFKDSRGTLAQARALRDAVQRATGKTPAILSLLAHAPVKKDLLYLMIELFRHSYWGMREMRGADCRPKLINAMDAFALDMLPVHEEGFYSGMMSTYHLGFDRMPSLRSGIGGFLLRHARWPRMAGRISRALGDGGDVIMVLAGGIETTARLNYALRERVGEWCRQSPRASDPGYVIDNAGSALSKWISRLTADNVIGQKFVKNRWRTIEMSLLYSALADGGFKEAKMGRLMPATRDAFNALGAALGYDSNAIASALRDLEAEFSRETSYRSRFFRFLANSVVRSGRPIILMPLTLGEPGRVELRWGDPVALEAVSGSVVAPIVTVRRWDGVTECGIDEFARGFVADGYR
ncbi:MAG: hypothetical protein COB53_01910 [Elusimicrobia bacterium]|nr:MAG: hypothetical protein COB53_01910 [Elusimicrobiota bacterium]